MNVMTFMLASKKAFIEDVGRIWIWGDRVTVFVCDVILKSDLKKTKVESRLSLIFSPFKLCECQMVLPHAKWQEKLLQNEKNLSNENVEMSE